MIARFKWFIISIEKKDALVHAITYYLSNYIDYTEMAGDWFGYRFVYVGSSFTRIGWASAW